MSPLSYSGYRFPRNIVQRAVWMYLRFTLSFRDVEELLAERGITVTYESIRRWVLTFGPAIARRPRARRPKPHTRWHLDEGRCHGNWEVTARTAGRIPSQTKAVAFCHASAASALNWRS